MNTASSQQQQVAAPSTTSQGQFNNIAPRTREERVSRTPTTLNLYRHLKKTVKRLRYRDSRSVLAASSNTLINQTYTTLIRYRLTL